MDPEQSRANHRKSHQKVGFDYVHVAVDDYTRFAYAEVLPDEKGPTCAGFLTRTAAAMAANGAPVKRVMTDNAFAYRLSRGFPGRTRRAERETHPDQAPQSLA